MIGWRIFLNPMELGTAHVWLVLPLCALVAVVYKAIRVEHLRDLPRQILNLWALMAVALTALGAAFYLLLEYVA